MCPSFGSTSRPADVPHFRPAGSSPQLRVTFGAGFGSPSPVMGLPIFGAVCADSDARDSGWRSAAHRKRAQAPNIESRIRGVDMTPPRESQDRAILEQQYGIASDDTILEVRAR